MAIRISGLLLFVAGSFVVSAASAQDTTKIHNFSLAPEVSKYEYKEPGLMKVKGTMWGVTGEYLNNGGVGKIGASTPIQFRARLTYMQGDNLEYTGSTWAGTPVRDKKQNHSYYDSVFAGGFEAKINEKFFIAPYLGLGYRYHVDKNDDVPGDYRREQTYWYLPMGADFKVPLARGWRFSANTELDILLRGENKTYLSDADPGYGDLKLRQNRGYGLRASVKVEKNFQSAGFFVEPFYRYWNISESNSKGITYGGASTGDSGVEPKNRTQEFGLRVGASF